MLRSDENARPLRTAKMDPEYPWLERFNDFISMD